MRVGLIAAILAVGGFAWAGPGDLDGDSKAPMGPSEEPLQILDVAKAAGCAAKVGVCLKPGAATTLLVGSQAVAGAKSAAVPTPRFSRAASVAVAGRAAPRAQTSLAWTLDVAAQLKRAAVSGNTLFVFFDMADPSSIKNQENVALFQAPVKAGKAMAAHLNLSTEDGFRAGHTYRMRIAQLLNGKEVVLAETDFSLL
jgi:ABC-type multidrug transport system fused ATPase/permease subunit